MKKYTLFILQLFLVVSLLGTSAYGGGPRPRKNASSRVQSRAISAQVNKQLRKATLETTAKPKISVTGYFHRLSDGKWADLEASVPPLKPAEKKPVPAFYKRSRESLELELSALGFQVENYSRDDMENLLASYQAFTAAKDVYSRYETTLDGTGANFMEVLARMKNWAESQPDYFEENYLDSEGVDAAITDYSQYKEPFNPQVKTLRILVVRDGSNGVRVLKDAAWGNNNIIIDHVDFVSTAMEKLKYHHYDIVLTDYVLMDGNGFEVSMYVWNKKLNIPVISYSAAPMNPHLLLKYNIVGAIPVATFSDEAEAALNYLSNVAATGRACPSGRKTPWP